MSLVVISTHPIQYHAPVYRALQTQFDIPVTVIYGSDFSTVGYYDAEFDTTFAWDTDLISGYNSIFLSRLPKEGAGFLKEVRPISLGNSLQQLKPEAVLILGYNHWFHQVAFYETWRGKYPILFRGETTDHAEKRGFLKNCFRDQVLHWTYKQCSKLLYIGQRSYQHFKRLGCLDEKLIFSPYCVGTGQFKVDEITRRNLRSELRHKLGISESEIVLLFTGKFSYRKGLDLLLKAIKELPSEIRGQIVTMLVGNGKLKESMEKLAQSPPQIKVIFVGFQNQTQLSSYYHGADLLLLPSRQSETWGLVVNEALHHGLPCVVSKSVGCAPDLIEPGVTGEIFETGMSPSLGSAIQRALKLINKDEIRERCRQKVNNYTVEKAAEGIARAYWDLRSRR